MMAVPLLVEACGSARNLPLYALTIVDINCRPSRPSQSGRKVYLHLRAIGLLLGFNATLGLPGATPTSGVPLRPGRPGTCPPHAPAAFKAPPARATRRLAWGFPRPPSPRLSLTCVRSK